MTIGDSLGRVFGKSPLKPLQEHMQSATAAVSLLVPLVASAQAGDWKQAAVHHRKLLKLAAGADKLKLQLRMQLRKSLFMPVSRSDLLELLTSQDLIADYSESFANLLVGRRMQVPEAALPAFEPYLEEVTGVAQLALDVVDELDEVFEVGFGSREMEAVYDKLQALSRAEKTAARLEARLRQRLYKLERNLEPLDAMFLYQLVDRLDQVARGAERVGNRLLILISI